MEDVEDAPTCRGIAKVSPDRATGAPVSDGLMATSAGNLLLKTEDGFFRAGDARSNENPLLTVIHTLWVREHNRVAAEVKTAFPRADDEELYQRTRKVIIALFQSVVYDEFIPAAAGSGVGS